VIRSLRLATIPRICDTIHREFVFAPMCKSDQASAAVTQSKPFIVARSKHIVPKERRIERLESGYTVREFSDNSEGQYWFVITALEVAS